MPGVLLPVGVGPTTRAVVSPLAPGGTLADALAAGTLSWADRVATAAAVADAVAALAAAVPGGHGRLSLSNVALVPGRGGRPPVPLLLDAGVSSLMTRPTPFPADPAALGGVVAALVAGSAAPAALAAVAADARAAADPRAPPPPVGVVAGLAAVAAALGRGDATPADAAVDLRAIAAGRGDAVAARLAPAPVLEAAFSAELAKRAGEGGGRARAADGDAWLDDLPAPPSAAAVEEAEAALV